MENRPSYNEPLSSYLRRRTYGNEEQVAKIMRWVAFSSLFVLLVLGINLLFKGKYTETVAILIGIVPIITSLIMINRGMLSLPITLFAISAIILLTYISAIGNGIHDVAIMAYPIILIVTGLILKGKILPYLTGFIILCLSWLVFADILGFITNL